MVLRPPALLEALKETAPEIAEAFVSAFERRVRERARKPSTGGDLERRLKDAETRVKNVTAGIARLPESEALYAQLATEEATTKRLRAEISQARPAGAQRVVLTRAAVRASIGKFLDLVGTETPRAWARNPRPRHDAPDADPKREHPRDLDSHGGASSTDPSSGGIRKFE